MKKKNTDSNQNTRTLFNLSLRALTCSLLNRAENEKQTSVIKDLNVKESKTMLLPPIL